MDSETKDKNFSMLYNKIDEVEKKIKHLETIHMRDSQWHRKMEILEAKKEIYGTILNILQDI